jgi:hypothetical protein
MSEAQGYAGANAGGATLGDLMRGKLGKLQKGAKPGKKDRGGDAGDDE